MDSTNKDLSHSINCSHRSFDRLIPTICQDRICLECGNDHSSNDAITNIDTLTYAGNAGSEKVSQK
jgi:hypothetical protein